jgi:hypothetical protein
MIGERIHRGPVKFKLVPQLVEQGPRSRSSIAPIPGKVELGTIAITKGTKESLPADKPPFLPGAVIGI